MDSRSRTDKQKAEEEMAAHHENEDDGLYFIPNSQPLNLNDAFIADDGDPLMLLVERCERYEKLNDSNKENETLQTETFDGPSQKGDPSVSQVESECMFRTSTPKKSLSDGMLQHFVDLSKETDDDDDPNPPNSPILIPEEEGNRLLQEILYSSGSEEDNDEKLRARNQVTPTSSRSSYCSIGSYGDLIITDEEAEDPFVFTATRSSNIKISERNRKRRRYKNNKLTCFCHPIVQEKKLNNSFNTPYFVSKRKQELYEMEMYKTLQSSDFQVVSQFIVGCNFQISLGITNRESVEPRDRVRILFQQGIANLDFPAHLFVNSCFERLRDGFYTFADRKGIEPIAICNGLVMVSFFANDYGRWMKLWRKHPVYTKYKAYELLVSGVTFMEMVRLQDIWKQMTTYYIGVLMENKLDFSPMLSVDTYAKSRAGT